MANYDSLINAVKAAVKTNGTGAITGATLQATLLGTIEELTVGFQFMGVATPETTPDSNDKKEFYLGFAGTYANFGSSVTVPEGCLILFKKDNSAWSSQTITVFDTLHVGVKSESEKSGSAWFFNDVTFESGKSYWAKLVSGYGNNARLGIASGTVDNSLKTGSWVKVTSPSTGHPYLYVGSATVAQPVIEVASGKSIIIPEIDDLDTKTAENAADISDIKKEVMITLSESEYNGSSAWFFNDVTFESGKSYYVRLVSGYGNNVKLAINNATVDKALKIGEWVEVTSPASGHPFFYVGSATVTQPVVEIASADNYIIKHIGDSDTHFAEIDAILNDVEIKDYDGVQSGSSWSFSGLTLTSGKKYFIKLISGQGENLALAIGATSGARLHLGEWVEYTALATGTPYIYTSGIFGQIPTIEVASFDNLIINQTKPIEADVKILKDGVKVTTINVSFDGTSKTGRTIHFSGLTAIADALNSITDASKMNRYVIHVEGEFHFTDPLTLTMFDGTEYSAILMKPYVDIEGDGPDRSIVFVDFPANATFHDGKHYNDYQPIYFYGVGGTVRNMKIVGKNCRYAFHIENSGAASAVGAEINVEGCTVVSYGAPDYSGDGTINCFGTGITNGQVWNIRNTEIINYRGSAFGMHTQLYAFTNIPVVNFVNCTIRGNLSLHNYQVENFTKVNIIGCTFTAGQVPVVYYPYYNNRTIAKHGDYTTILLNANSSKLLFRSDASNTNQKGSVLRVVSLATGTSSKVRFDEDSSAFDVIVGDSNLSGILKTIYCWDTQFGFVYRDGGIGLSGQAFGTIDVDENSAADNSLGSLLGDCTSENKTLGITIDGTDYSVVFDEDYTTKDNDYVIAAINAVIGSVATADVFSPATLYYPLINHLCEVVNIGSSSILRGMGVVFEDDGMRIAKNSDGYIDGICIDDCANGQTARVISCGYIYSAVSASPYVRTKEVSPATRNVGDLLGIDPENDGQFILNATPALLRCKKENVLELL